MSLNTDRFCGNALVPTTSKYSVYYIHFSRNHMSGVNPLVL
jgi:hypothetical protein